MPSAVRGGRAAALHQLVDKIAAEHSQATYEQRRRMLILLVRGGGHHFRGFSDAFLFKTLPKPSLSRFRSESRRQNTLARYAEEVAPRRQRRRAVQCAHGIGTCAAIAQIGSTTSVRRCIWFVCDRLAPVFSTVLLCTFALSLPVRTSWQQTLSIIAFLHVLLSTVVG